MCHAELMLRIDGPTWYRFSINKGTIHVARDGRESFVPGTVFCKPVLDLNQYTFVRVAMTRERQYNIYRFVRAQLGARFHRLGYYTNFVAGTQFGVRRFHGGLYEKRRAWFCSELICAAMQAGGLLTSFRPCLATPNMLYRESARLPEANAGMHPKRVGPGMV